MQICILGAQWVLRQVWSFNSSSLSQLIPHALFPSAPAQCHDRHCACHSSEMILIQIRMGSPLATPAQIWIIHSSCLVNKHTWSWLVVKFVNGLQLFPWRTTIIHLQWVTNCFLSQIFLSTSASPSALLNILQQIASGWIHSSCRSYIHCQYYIAMPMTFQTNKSWEQNIQDHSSTCSQLGAPSTTSPTHSIRSSWKLDELVASSFEMLLLWPVRANLSSDDISMSDISGLQRHKNGKTVLVETIWKLKEKLFRRQDLGRTSIQ